MTQFPALLRMHHNHTFWWKVEVIYILKESDAQDELKQKHG